jgi:hypothetical protein
MPERHPGVEGTIRRLFAAYEGVLDGQEAARAARIGRLLGAPGPVAAVRRGPAARIRSAARRVRRAIR